MNPQKKLKDLEAQDPTFIPSSSIRWLIQRVKTLENALELAGGQLGNPDIGTACVLACKTISKALAGEK